jgi:uncharacterized membrane protein YbhN (UPF0104 family)
MLTFVVTVLSHVPGGYGIFEVVFLSFFPEDLGPSVIAALIVFRIVYYWTPLLIAAILLSHNEWTLAKDAAESPDLPKTETDV